MRFDYHPFAGGVEQELMICPLSVSTTQSRHAPYIDNSE
jgi:hypothetical protein